ncbi:Ig-like domain-containing protein [Methanoculleus chikugoensis]|uniref:Ig-like domain-containing protein n=1 Tax=Methanoculleus chikugoensis TaxID=118126 RepID=UPI0006D28E57|nr:Ig-like domain-containing protein [Methanoculleus chikugoensis]
MKATIDADAKTTISGGSTEFKPALSERYVAWVNASDGERVWYYDIDAGTSGPVSTNKVTQSWPSLYGSIITWEDRRVNADIYMTDLDDPSGGEQRITFDTSEQVSPAISASIIAWEDMRPSGRSIFMYDHLSGGEEMSVGLAEDRFDEHLYPPAISGNTIVWQRGGRGSDSNLYIFVYEPGAPVEPELTTIEVNPPSAPTLEIGDTEQFNATAFDQNDLEITDVEFNWSCSNTTVGTIDGTGLFTAHAAGTATITATAEGVPGTATVTVNAEDPPAEPVLTSITLTPPTPTLKIDGTQQFTATAFDQFEEEMNGIAFNWSCDNETVGTIDNASGFFTALAAGTATITATAEGVPPGTTTVTVTADEPVVPVVTRIAIDPSTFTLDLNATKQFNATAYDQDDNAMTGVEFNWSCNDETIGEIDSTGVFTAKVAGTATIVASADGKSGEATVTVTDEAPVARSITVTPSTPTLAIDDTQQFSATVLDQFGGAMTGVAVIWSCSNETVGEIDGTGVFTAKAAGTATIVASADGKSGEATVTITAKDPVGPEEPVLTSITLTPPPRATLDAEDIQRFMVTGHDQNGNAMPAGEIDWACSDEAVGTIDGEGRFTALAAGTATVTATAGTCSAEAAITVCEEEPPLAKIAVVPSAAKLETGDELEFRAVAFDRFGNIVEDAEITWESSDPCVGTIDECGVFTARDGGTATITACGDGAEGTATVTVNCNDPVVTSIVVTPAAITLAAGDTAAFTATALDQDGCEIPDVTIEWGGCCAETVGEVDDTGFFTAHAAGTATVTASAEGGVAGTAEIEVTEESAGVVVSPSAIILNRGGDKWQFTTVHDLQDNAGSMITRWSCEEDEGVGTIDESSGLFTALCGGGTTSVTATIDGVDEVGTATVTVRSTAPELARIEVSPSDFCIPAGNCLTLTARGFDQYGLPMDVDVDWESSDPCVGEIDLCSGAFTALAEGGSDSHRIGERGGLRLRLRDRRALAPGSGLHRGRPA